MAALPRWIGTNPGSCTNFAISESSHVP
jgi:hypothetical protein